ncbi:dihydroxyacetone kinase phosphoryl donor subunit DhaM [Vibrio sp. CAU 1672]|uniref:dihydroxyacetone kinase phosphoryl donor subunit DhaM n=1 Tax=Vibrio sp. CAU 1672 TaxID=3032594 RepID=UPI0023DA5B82|nr:dihydroxyacetone kinase phosphoryl donor subunit DhaM [Vibrio sp. CAU 1672]MDF2153552.1 dihydroxyacetone kinase phosphoryl donor subunit DhaM [Vibrio sp. CAU 1672]
MVSIVIVSHSRRLAEGLLELTAQITHGKIAMAIAAGIDDPENPIGTDALAVKNAIEKVYRPDGVLVLVDIGSAILSADMALELLPPDKVDAVKICPAPLVEGTIAASVAAAAGQPIDIVLMEAHSAIAAKYQALEQPLPQMYSSPSAPFERPSARPPANDISPDQTLSFSWTIRSPHGLHIRPAAVLAAELGRFTAKIWLSKNGKKVNAKSLNNIMSLGIRNGDTLTFTACGNDAEAVIDALKSLTSSKSVNQ